MLTANDTCQTQTSPVLSRVYVLSGCTVQSGHLRVVSETQICAFVLQQVCDLVRTGISGKHECWTNRVNSQQTKDSEAYLCHHCDFWDQWTAGDHRVMCWPWCARLTVWLLASDRYNTPKTVNCCHCCRWISVDPLQLSAVVQPAVDIKYLLFMLDTYYWSRSISACQH